MKFSLFRRLRGAGAFVITLLVIEFIDELLFGIRETSWPIIRADLDLTYAQIGLLIGVPSIFATVIELFMGLLADRPGWRTRLILGGAVAFGGSVLVSAIAGNFDLMMAATLVLYPASGAFVSLSQATLMDTDPARHEQNMARWTFFGATGILAAPLLLIALDVVNAGWREAYGLVVVLTVIAGLTLWALRRHFPAPGAFVDPDDEDESTDDETAETGGQHPNLLIALWQAVRLMRGEVLRWFVLLEFADLMMDILLSFLALYFVDVVGTDPATAALAVGLWTGVGLIGDFLVIPLFERVNGVAYLRISVAIILVLFPLFLVVEPVALKLILLALIGFTNAGWYSVLQAQVYSALPGRSGTVTTLGTLLGPIHGLIPIIIGAVAGLVGLGAAMWLLWLGPLALLIGLPWRGVRLRRDAE